MNHKANIFEAIARSRGVRRARARRRRRVTIAAVASTVAAVPLFFSLVGVTGNDLVHAAANQARSLSDLLDGRSPGERTTAQLTKTKHSKPPFSAAAPPERQAPAPSVIRKGDFGEFAQLVAAPPLIDIAPPAPQAADLTTLPEILGGSGPGTVAAPPGGGEPVSFPASETHETVPVPAVPEPGTWATMLLGFGLLGWRVRRRPNSTAKKPAV